MTAIDPSTKTPPPTSEAQIHANRENAKRSTGPRTEAGKARSRLNALQYGLTAKTIVLPGEDAAELQELYEQIRADLKPQGAFEEQLVERITSCFWRLRRCEEVEEQLYTYRLLQDIEEDGLTETRPIPSINRAKGIPYYSEDDRREGAMAAHRDAFLLHLMTMGRAFLRDVMDGNAIATLNRYETTHLRNLQRYWVELDRKQVRRLETPLPQEK
jgi:hypothetical protein